MLTESDATCSNTDTPQTVTRCGLFYPNFLLVGSDKAVQNNLLRSMLSGELKVLISLHHTASGSAATITLLLCYLRRVPKTGEL